MSDEQTCDGDVRDALQGMRQPQPGIVFISDVLAYVEPRLLEVRQLTDDRDRARATTANFQRIIDASDVIERSTREDVEKALAALRNGDFGEAQDLLGDLLESLR